MPLPDFESAEVSDEQLETQETEGSGEPEESIDEKLSKVQQTVQTGLQQNQQLVGLLADPDIQEVLRRKQQGQRFQITEPQTEPEPEPNFEEMDQKQLAQYLGKQNVKLVQDTVQQVMQPLVQQLQGMQTAVQQTQQEKAVQVVQATAQKYVDFDKYRDRMVQLAEVMTKATPEQLYVMAVTEAGKQPQLRSAVKQQSQRASSERPSHTTARPGQRQVPKNLSLRETWNHNIQNALRNIDTTGLNETSDD
jgi:hypothetical protein